MSPWPRSMPRPSTINKLAHNSLNLIKTTSSIYHQPDLLNFKPQWPPLTAPSYLSYWLPFPHSWQLPLVLKLNSWTLLLITCLTSAGRCYVRSIRRSREALPRLFLVSKYLQCNLTDYIQCDYIYCGVVIMLLTDIMYICRSGSWTAVPKFHCCKNNNRRIREI